MAETVSMPKLGFDMREGTLVRWVKNEGEQVNKGDVLAEIETDKATVEVESSASGVVRKLLVGKGDIVPVGAAIAIVGTADEKIELPVEQGKAEQGKVGQEKVEKGEGGSGTAGLATPTQTTPKAAPVLAAVPVPVATGPVKASPLAKKIARDHRLDLSRIHGSGPGGRVVRRDVESALAGGPAGAQAAGAPAVERRAGPTAAPFGAVPTASRADETVQTSKLRQAIGRRLVESKQNLPHFYVSYEYKVDSLLDMRRQINDYLPQGEKLSVNDFIVKAVALTLRQFPNLNASLDGDKVVRHGGINVGVAVTVEGGLLTVVCRDADQKPLRQISLEVKTMAGRAREGKVKPDDVDGSTFSTSNLGMYDVENFIAIINPPEAAILAIGAAREVPVAENGQLKVGQRLKATISVDHRVSDGAEAAQFMQALAGFLENPARLLV